MKEITPALVPHEKFHKGAWLQPVERPEWYYFLEKKNTPNTISHRGFLKSVDKPLRPLVKWLHDCGFKTTPSCSGHHASERSLESIYEGLKKDAKAIRNGGLKLKDIETGKEYLYRKAQYKLPWDKNAFLRKALVYQQKGVLGIHLGKHTKLKRALKQMNIPGVYIGERRGIVLLFAEGDEGNNGQIWRKVTAHVKKLFKEQLT